MTLDSTILSEEGRKKFSSVPRALLAVLMILSALVIAPAAASADPDVVGGVDAIAGAHPSIAEITVDVPGWDGHWCGGTLIDPDWVITAAHCMYASGVRIAAQNITVTLGEHQISVAEDSEQEFQPAGIYLHPDYEHDTSDHGDDLALIRLDGTATLGDDVELVSIAPYDDTETLTLAGWGDTTAGDVQTLADILQVADFTNGQDCYSTAVCFGVEGVSSCYGDSGGPWYRDDGDGNEQLVLVHSAGARGCPTGGLSLGVEANEHIDWIFDTMADDMAIFSINAPNGWATRIGDDVTDFSGRGWHGQIPLSGDMNGDGRDELVVHNIISGGWYARDTVSEAFLGYHSSGTGDIPLSGDLDGDGLDEFISFDQGIWNAAELSGEATVTDFRWGTRDDRPLVGDVDGDGIDEMIVWRPSNGKWYARNRDGVTQRVLHWGTTGDTPLIGDFDGDGDDDYMIWRSSNGKWYARHADGTRPLARAYRHGGKHDVPRVGDMNGDGNDDLIIWRPRTGKWYGMDSTDGGRIDGWGTTFGSVGDWPVVGQFG